MGRAPCCDKANVKRGPWSPDEDDILKNYIESHGTGGNWIALPKKAGLRRCGKSCRLRWLNYLRPDIKHGGFTEEEDNIIVKLYNEVGSRWSVIASQLSGRTDNDIKNYWNTKLKKKILSGKITNPTTNAMDTDHQPRGISDHLLPSLQYVSSSSVSDQFHALSNFPEPFDMFAHSYVVKPEIGTIGSDHFGNNNNGSIGSIGSDHFGNNNGNATIPAQECSSIASSNSPGMETGFGGSPGGQFDDWLDFSWEKIIEKLLSDDASIGPNFTDDLNFQ